MAHLDVTADHASCEFNDDRLVQLPSPQEAVVAAGPKTGLDKLGLGCVVP